MDINSKINKIRSKIPHSVKLVAVSKTKPNSYILDAYNSGQKIFGENKVQDIVDKHNALPKDIEWHFIGHLQTNKVKYLAPFISLIHGVDSLKLLQSINKEGAKNNRVIDCLLQVHIAQEDTKFGFSKDELINMLYKTEHLDNVRISGLMGMASYTDDTELIRSEFKSLKELFNNLKNNFFNNKDFFKELSMGMSSDYTIAVEEGSTMIRVGSSIFGSRN